MAQEQEQKAERTLVLLKPDALVRGFAGKIIARFEDAALKVVGVKMKQMDADFTRRHYFDLEERLGSEVYEFTARFMQQGPVIALVLEGFDAIATVRKIVGSTYPNEAPAGAVAPLSRQIAIGCVMAWIGGISGAMVGVLVSKIVQQAIKAPVCDGIPTCDWYIYAAVGGTFGALSLPWLVVSALRRPVPPAKSNDESA